MYIFQILETCKKKLKLKALPTVNLPKKSIDAPQIHHPVRTNNLVDKYTEDSQENKEKVLQILWRALHKRLSSMKYIKNNSLEKTIGNGQI